MSFTFDDFPESAARQGAETLESFGARGTFYASLGIAGEASVSGPISTAEGVVQLAQSGHEIGCHTFTHIDCSVVDESRTEVDCRKNREAAADLGLPELRSFSYPFGGINSAARRIMADGYETARTVWPGVNRGRYDAAALRAVPLMQQSGDAIAASHLRSLLKSDGWLVFYTHDVSENPSAFGCRPSVIQKFCERALEGGAEVLPVSSVGQR